MTFTLEPTRRRSRTERDEPAEATLVEVEPAPAPALTWPVEQPVERAAEPARVRAALTRSAALTRQAALGTRAVLTKRAPLTARAARWVAVISFLAYWLPAAIMPPPDGSNPVMPWWAATLDYGSLILLAGSWLLLGAGRRSGLVASVAGSLGVLALTAECPISDHHEIAPWWWAQLAASVGVLALSALLLRRTKRA
jgi:hypothetical protein